MKLGIAEGKIEVNGEPAHIGQRVSWGDRVAVNGKPVKIRIAPPLPRMLAYHKPVGEIVTFNDPEGRPTVFRTLPKLQMGKWLSVGRLDINTEGLLLFTNSGDLANQLMHPRFGVEREYAVRVLGQLDDESKAKLLSGVEVDGQTAAFKSIESVGGEGVKSLVSRRHHRRPQPRSAQAVRHGGLDRQPADPCALCQCGAAARSQARGVG